MGNSQSSMISFDIGNFKDNNSPVILSDVFNDGCLEFQLAYDSSRDTLYIYIIHDFRASETKEFVYKIIIKIENEAINTSFRFSEKKPFVRFTNIKYSGNSDNTITVSLKLVTKVKKCFLASKTVNKSPIYALYPKDLKASTLFNDEDAEEIPENFSIMDYSEKNSNAKHSIAYLSLPYTNELIAPLTLSTLPSKFKIQGYPVFVVFLPEESAPNPFILLYNNSIIGVFSKYSYYTNAAKLFTLDGIEDRLFIYGKPKKLTLTIDNEPSKVDLTTTYDSLLELNGCKKSIIISGQRPLFPIHYPTCLYISNMTDLHIYNMRSGEDILEFTSRKFVTITLRHFNSKKEINVIGHYSKKENYSALYKFIEETQFFKKNIETDSLVLTVDRNGLPCKLLDCNEIISHRRVVVYCNQGVDTILSSSSDIKNNKRNLAIEVCIIQDKKIKTLGFTVFDPNNTCGNVYDSIIDSYNVDVEESIFLLDSNMDSQFRLNFEKSILDELIDYFNICNIRPIIVVKHK